jgi:hypothetical protein
MRAPLELINEIANEAGAILNGEQDGAVVISPDDSILLATDAKDLRRAMECLSALVYWHDCKQNIDCSWWSYARNLVKEIGEEQKWME